MNRTSHTTKQNKAKCLAYRDGRRCGRVAKVIVAFHDTHNGIHRRIPVCTTCARVIVNQYGREAIQQESAKGFIVAIPTLGPASRTYHSIE